MLAITAPGGAELAYSCDSDPGWRRRRCGRGFTYRDTAGHTLSADVRARLEALAIPPAWDEVWICPDPNGHIQVTGRDERGRKQYLYHPLWTRQRSQAKFETLVDFARALPRLREGVEADLRRRRMGLPLVAASVVWLLDNSLIRVGNPRYARDNSSYGLTTLRRRHVEIAGPALRFRFKGKSGKQWRLELTDRRMARLISGLQDLPGQSLFQYEDETGLHPITSREVNDYIAALTGSPFTSRHFRTWAATSGAYGLLASEPPPASQAEARRKVNTVLDAVAARLGNTRAVCRSSYVHPAILADWSEGRPLRRGRGRAMPHMDEDEVRTLAYLRARMRDDGETAKA